MFSGEVALQTVLESSPQFHQMVASNRSEDRAFVNKMLKSLAVDQVAGD